MQVTRHQRLALIAIAVVVAAVCLCAYTAEGKPSSSSSSSSSSTYETPEAREIRERKELRDRLIAEKKAKKAAKEEKKAKAEEKDATKTNKKKKQEEVKSEKPTNKKKSSKADQAAAAKAAADKKAADEAADQAAAVKKAKAAAQAKANADAEAKKKAADTPAAKAAAAKEAQRRKVRLDKALKRAVELKQRRVDRLKKRKDRLAARRKNADARRRARLEASKPDVIAKGVEKLKWFEKQVRTSKGSKVIDISYPNFKKYVHASPRPYWLFVVFTALSDRYTCSICRTVKPEMETLAKIYHADRQRWEVERQTNMTEGTFIMKNENDFSNDIEFDSWKRQQMPIFFVQVDIDSNGEVFRALNMQSAPTMIVMQPTQAASPPPLNALLTSLPGKNKYQLTKADITSSDLNEFIQKVTGRTVSLSTAREPGLAGLISAVKNMLQMMDPVRYLLLCVASVMVCLLIVLWLFQYAYRRFQQYQSLRSRQGGIISKTLTSTELAPLKIFSQYSLELQHQSIGTPSLTRSNVGVVSPGAFEKPRSLGLFRWWFIVVGCLVYLFGISGGMFNILRGNSSYSFDFLKNPRTFDIWKYVNGGDSHDQSVMEGLMLGILQLILATIVIFLNRCTFMTHVVTPSSQPRTTKDRAIGCMRWFLNCLLSPVIWATLAFLTWRLIVAIYSKKNGGYRHGFVWKHITPQHFKFISVYANRVLNYAPKTVAQTILRWF